MLRALSAAALSFLLAACGQPSAPQPPPVERRPPAAPRAELALTVEVAQPGDRSPRRAALRCAAGHSEADGFLTARAADACRAARRARSVLTDRPPAGRVCTGLYGGPQTARVSGRVDGRPVNRRLSRRNGCEIADWDRLGGLLDP